jgi:hypothetical protein
VTTSATEDTDHAECWDLGIELLLQGKAHEAAEQQRQHAAASAVAARNASQQMRSPHCNGKGQQPQMQVTSMVSSSSPPNCGATPAVSQRNSSSMPRASVAVLQHQDSSCSSRSRSSSFAGSVASFQQLREAAQQQAMLLSSAPVSELQACRMWAMLRQWEELRELLSQ